jgi:hypothetical protein
VSTVTATVTDTTGNTASSTVTYTLVASRGAAPLGSLTWATQGTVVRTTPGNAATALKTVPDGGTLELAAGVYNETLAPVANRAITIQPAPGAVVYLDGAGTRSQAIIASGRITVRGIGFRNYAPTGTSNGTATVFLGGTSAGTQFVHCWFQNIGKSPAISGETSDVTVASCTIEDCMYAGISMGTSVATTAPHRFKLVDTIIRRVNKGGYNDGQVSACKITRAKDVLFDNCYIEDVNGANGLWTDVSCTNPTAVNCELNGVGAVKAGTFGIEYEETEGGLIAGCKVYGGWAVGIGLVATGGVKVWNSDIRGNPVALDIRQDRPGNSYTNPLNSPGPNGPGLDDAPWLSKANKVYNTYLESAVGYKIALTVYTSKTGVGLMTWQQQLTEFKGNRFGAGTIQMGRADGVRDTLTAAQVGAAMGAGYSDITATVPADVAALLK